MKGDVNMKKSLIGIAILLQQCSAGMEMDILSFMIGIVGLIITIICGVKSDQ